MQSTCLYVARVKDPVCDVRQSPTAGMIIQNGLDRRRETQILQSDCVHVVAEQDGWSLVDVPIQSRGQAEGLLRPYRGWVVNESLEKSDRCRCVLQDRPGLKSREAIVKEALSFIGQPCVLGGLSHLGIDCSGLVYTSFKNNGILLPRDCIDQHAVMMSISRRDLEPADLLFCTGTQGRINHVMIWDGEQIIEAAEQGRSVVRRVYFEEKFGVAMRHFQSYGTKQLYFCRCVTKFYEKI